MENSSIADCVTLSECNGVYTGQAMHLSSLVFYQLRDHDIQGNPFVHVILTSERRFRGPSLALELEIFDTMPVNPGMSSFHIL